MTYSRPNNEYVGELVDADNILVKIVDKAALCAAWEMGANAVEKEVRKEIEFLVMKLGLREQAILREHFRGMQNV